MKRAAPHIQGVTVSHLNIQAFRSKVRRSALRQRHNVYSGVDRTYVHTLVFTHGVPKAKRWTGIGRCHVELRPQLLIRAVLPYIHQDQRSVDQDSPDASA